MIHFSLTIRVGREQQDPPSEPPHPDLDTLVENSATNDTPPMLGFQPGERA